MRRRFAAMAGAFGVLALVAGGSGLAAAAPRWTYAGAADANVRGFAFDPKEPKTVYAAARNDGVWISRDAGATWAASNRGLDFIAVWSLAVDPTSPNIVWAATEVGGAYRSTDFGRSWRHTHAGATDTRQDYALTIPALPSSTELLRPSGGPIFRDLAPDKANRGGMWGYVIDQCVSDQEQSRMPEKCAERADWPPGGYNYRDADVDAAISGNQPGVPFPRQLVRFQFSSDIVAFPGGAMLTAFRGSGNRLGGGTFVTRNGGATWSMALRDGDGNRLASFGAGGSAANIWRVRVAPSNSKIVYLAGTGGVWRSSDGGKTWPSAPASHGGTIPHSIRGQIGADTRGLAVDPKTADVAYAGTWGAGVRVSRDGGGSWSDSSAGLPGRSGIWSLSFDPLDSKHMYAAVYRHGAYESRDAGASWTPLNDGFDPDTRSQVYAIERARDGTLYAGTINGVWKLAAPASVKGARKTRPLAHTGVSDVALIVGGAVLVAVAVGIAWAARSR